MEKLLLIFAVLVLGLAGCQEKDPALVLSVCIFEPVETGRVATEADQVALQAYADTIYNPRNRPELIDSHGAEKMGYSFRFSARQPLDASGQTIFSQGLPSGPKAVQDVAVGRLEAGSHGSYEFSVYVGGKEGAENDSSFVKANISGAGAGAVKLADGWIAAWVVESEEG